MRYMLILLTVFIANWAWAADITIHRPDGTEVVFTQDGGGNGNSGYRMELADFKLKFKFNKMYATRKVTKNCYVRTSAIVHDLGKVSMTAHFNFEF